MSEEENENFPTDEDVERVAIALSETYRYRYYVGPLPTNAHRDKAREVLESVKAEMEHNNRV